MMVCYHSVWLAGGKFSVCLGFICPGSLSRANGNPWVLFAEPALTFVHCIASLNYMLYKKGGGGSIDLLKPDFFFVSF